MERDTDGCDAGCGDIATATTRPAEESRWTDYLRYSVVKVEGRTCIPVMAEFFGAWAGRALVASAVRYREWEQLDHHFAEVAPGIKLHYVDAGPRDATPVVLVHGWPDLAFAWRYHIAELSKAYRVIAPDLRGFGRSSAPQETEAYGFKNITSDFAKLLDILNLPRAVFVGHDWGGAMVYRMALYHPERVIALTAFLTPYYPPSDTYIDYDALAAKAPSLGYMKFLADTEASSKLLENAPSQVFTMMFRPPESLTPDGVTPVPFVDLLHGVGHSSHPMYTQRSDLLSEEELAFYVAEYARSGFKGPVSYYATRAIDFETDRGLPRVIQHRTLYVGGGKDTVLKPEMAAHMPQFVPNLETAIVEEGGHWLLWSHKAETADVLLKWLNKLDPAASH
ncbi:hypothetical protein PybrP1_011604 [[Pythium] brassicae (nom. inval.)]|nr:hypothetical protein PybrP1_011604 [[Pythium] brassicae (nom. inval.)]